MIEHTLEDFSEVYCLHYVILRYFNVPGAHESISISEIYNRATHLILIIIQHLLGEREKILVFRTNKL